MSKKIFYYVFFISSILIAVIDVLLLFLEICKVKFWRTMFLWQGAPYYDSFLLNGGVGKITKYMLIFSIINIIAFNFLKKYYCKKYFVKKTFDFLVGIQGFYVIFCIVVLLYMVWWAATHM